MRVRRLVQLAVPCLLLALLSAVFGASDFVNRIKDLAWEKDVATARQLIEARRPEVKEVTSEWLAALSWLARGASFAERWDVAETYAQEVFDASRKLLDKTKLEDDYDLEIALGASIEVLGRAYAQQDRRKAADFLRRQREKYRGTPVETRIQKNYLLVSLEGVPFPDLEETQFIGKARLDSSDLEDKVVLYYFWAHWCGDCKAQKPILDRLHAEYGGRGLVIAGPTRLYGYVSRGEAATPEQELDYLNNAYQQKYPIPSWMPVPVSTKNFVDFGVSTTPTLVLVDRSGTVRLYHPGKMSYEELRGHIEPLLAEKTD